MRQAKATSLAGCCVCLAWALLLGSALVMVVEWEIQFVRVFCLSVGGVWLQCPKYTLRDTHASVFLFYGDDVRILDEEVGDTTCSR